MGVERGEARVLSSKDEGRGLSSRFGTLGRRGSRLGREPTWSWRGEQVWCCRNEDEGGTKRKASKTKLSSR